MVASLRSQTFQKTRLAKSGRGEMLSVGTRRPPGSLSDPERDGPKLSASRVNSSRRVTARSRSDPETDGIELTSIPALRGYRRGATQRPPALSSSLAPLSQDGSLGFLLLSSCASFTKLSSTASSFLSPGLPRCRHGRRVPTSSGKVDLQKSTSDGEIAELARETTDPASFANRLSLSAFYHAI
jgi:hypothetical protein